MRLSDSKLVFEKFKDDMCPESDALSEGWVMVGRERGIQCSTAYRVDVEEKASGDHTRVGPLFGRYWVPHGLDFGSS